jgi:hypothetical protein
MLHSFKRISIASLLFLSIACTKTADSPSNTTLITASAWKYSSSGIDNDKNGTIDTDLPAGTINACDKDNIVTFKNDFTGILDEGATKCDPALPQTSTIIWKFNNNEKGITLPVIFAGISGDMIIQQLTSTNLVLQKEVNIGLPSTVNAIFIFKH